MPGAVSPGGRRLATAGRPVRWAFLVSSLLLLGSPSIGGAPVAGSAGPPSVAWAYGGQLEGAGGGSAGQVQLSYPDHSESAVLLNQTNGTDGRLQLTLTRALATFGTFTACYPSCDGPGYQMKGASAGYEYETARLVLTAAATVATRTGTVAAWGLVSEQLTMVGNLTVELHWSSNLSGGPAANEWFNASTAANTSGSIAPRSPLGLVPLAPTANRSWNDSATVDASSATSFSGRLGYVGSIVPPNGSAFAGTSTPVSPTLLAVNGSVLGRSAPPALANDSSLTLNAAPEYASLLEGAILVPTASYVYAAFDSGCDLAQRPCIAVSSTPILDLNPHETDHLGWEAAASSVSAFALRFNASAVYDLPNGRPFWPAAAGLPAFRPGLGPAPAATVQGVPITVEQAEAVQASLLPSVGPGNGGGGGGGPSGSVPVAAPPHGVRSPAVGPLGSWNRSVPAEVPVPWVAIGLALSLAAVATTIAVRGRRRRSRPLLVENEEQSGSSSPSPNEEEGTDDPMGYVW